MGEPAPEAYPSFHVSDIPLNRQYTPDNPAPEDFLTATSRNILQAVQVIEEQGNNARDVKESLGNLLKAREESYYAVAKQLNPDIKREDDSLYSIPGEHGEKIFGSVVSIIDAASSLSKHIPLTRQLRLGIEGGETVMGEQPDQLDFDSSIVVVSGSEAQKRSQEHAADLDLAEHIRIQATTREDAARKLAQAIQRSVVKETALFDDNGKETRIVLKCMNVGEYPDDAAESLRKRRLMGWSIADIQQGSKTYKAAEGGKKQITLQEVCKNPSGLRFEYLGITPNDVFEITKVSTTIAKNGEEVLFDNSKDPVVAFNEVYYDNPSKLNLLEHTTDPGRFVEYISTNLDQVLEYTDPNNQNLLKASKKLYAVLKAAGDVPLAQQLAGIFRTDAALLHKMLARLRPAREAVEQKLTTGAVEQDRYFDVWDAIQGNQELWPQELQDKFATQGVLSNQEIKAAAQSIINKQSKDYLMQTGILDKVQGLLPVKIDIE